MLLGPASDRAPTHFEHTLAMSDLGVLSHHYQSSTELADELNKKVKGVGWRETQMEYNQSSPCPLTGVQLDYGESVSRTL